MFSNPLQRLPLFFTALVILFASEMAGIAQKDSGSMGFYREEVHPLLEKRCFKCHGGGEKLKGGFRVTNREDLLRGGDLGPAFNLENPKDSLILKMISYDDEDHKMPPKSKLSPGEIDLLQRWVTSGALYDPKLEIAGKASDRKKKKHITEADRKYWAYQPVQAVKLPTDLATGVSPIDALLEVNLNKPELNPMALLRGKRSSDEQPTI